MKKTLTALAVAAIFAACTSKPKMPTDTANSVTLADTLSMNHNSLTDKGAEINLNGISDTIVGSNGQRYAKVEPNGHATYIPVHHAPIVRRAATLGTTSHKSTAGSGTGGTSVSSAGTGSAGNTGAASTTPVVAKKKGWSNTLKGAVIGAGSGAVAGALIDKNKVRGAIIGGVAGAGGGFVVGKILDKKAAKNQ